MREIKFRAWDKKNKKIFKVENLYWHSDGFICVNEGDDITFADVELMQFTGLVDKNKRRIYEGDIVRFKDINLQVGFYNAHFIIYDKVANEGGTGHEDLWKALARGEVEVIGNIYENKELL